MGSAKKCAAKRVTGPARPKGLDTPSREEQAIMRKEQLLSAALKLFCEHGYSGTSTKRIAHEAGVVEGLIFHYFPSKEHILFELASRSTTFAGKALDVLVRAEGQTARALLLGIASAFGDVSAEERRFVGFMLAEAQVNPSLGARARDAHAAAIAHMAGLLSARVTAGELRRGVSLDLATQGFLGGFVFFLGQHRHLADEAWRVEATRFADEWADLCWRGLAAAQT